MKLLFLGSGSAFTVNGSNYHSNMLLVDDAGAKLLIDCGSDARLALAELGLTYKDIQAVYVSHLHADHVGGLEWLGFSSYFDPNCEKPHLYCHHSLKAPLWENVLSGGMSSLQSHMADLSTYFKVHTINDNEAFFWNTVSLKTVQTLHVMNGFKILPSFGLVFTVNNTKALITTDTQFAPTQLGEFYEWADIIFQDCETSKTMSGVHANYTELLTLTPEIRRKMWLYHYNPGPLPNAKKDGFCGFVVKGQVFDLG